MSRAALLCCCLLSLAAAAAAGRPRHLQSDLPSTPELAEHPLGTSLTEDADAEGVFNNGNDKKEDKKDDEKDAGPTTNLVSSSKIEEESKKEDSNKKEAQKKEDEDESSKMQDDKPDNKNTPTEQKKDDKDDLKTLFSTSDKKDKEEEEKKKQDEEERKRKEKEEQDKKDKEEEEKKKQDEEERKRKEKEEQDKKDKDKKDNEDKKDEEDHNGNDKHNKDDHENDHKGDKDEGDKDHQGGGKDDHERLMAEMRAKAEQQRAAEEAREAERRAREGDAYRTPEQRAEAARAARAAAAEAGQGGLDGEEARVLEKRFDPSRNYYEVLGIPRGASAADVRKAYKRLALLYHPDKHKGEGGEQQAAIADKFKQVVEAFDVLINEEQRAVYDKCRDYQETHPGKDLPVLSPEEAALMRSGIAELSRLRRQGLKATKHPPLEKEVYVSLPKLNAGCTKTVAVERRRVRPDGTAFTCVKNVHAVIRRGSREGDRLVFEEEGEETVDTQPGDLILLLRQKPHPLYHRVGAKDLEMFGGAAAAGEPLFAVEVTTIQGKKRLLSGSALREAAANGGAGGVWQAVLPGQGLYDAAEPWEKPAGDLRVQLRYPAWLLKESAIKCCLQPRPVHLVGSGNDVVAAALAAGSVAGMLNHRREAAEMAAAQLAAAAAAHKAAAEGATLVQDTSSGCNSLRSESSCSGGCSAAGPTVVCLVVSHSCATPSPAAAAMLSALRRRVPGLEASAVASGCLLDDEWLALGQADAIIVDWLAAEGGTALDAAAAAGSVAAAAGPAEEAAIGAAHCQLEAVGLLELLWQRFWGGCLLVGVGQGCALLGRGPAGSCEPAASIAPPVLPWYRLRAGGGTSGWATLHASLGSPGGSGSCFIASGILGGGVWVADPTTGSVDMLVAPCRDALVALAAWSSQPGNQPEEVGLEEAAEEHGFMAELARA
ncbi:subfamily B member 4 [Chlorella sorokiniana]|uniref:Subfamily B member 4 n=1 Tax=Chlorella sorokiniana TaxID=3076 RepID=A0A2P6U3A9_CHLSO|nr:subfamily B member 4 [Chlorella sorokiniana]|eukprot:PRW60794.1 subfamily B member 4 [Chlorella sorokiniana]